MEVSGQPQPLPVYPLGMKPPVPIEWEAQLATGLFWMFKITDKPLVYAEIRTRDRSARSLTL